MKDVVFCFGFYANLPITRDRRNRAHCNYRLLVLPTPRPIGVTLGWGEIRFKSRNYFTWLAGEPLIQRIKSVSDDTFIGWLTNISNRGFGLKRVRLQCEKVLR